MKAMLLKQILTQQAQKGKDNIKVDVDIPAHASRDDYDEFILYSKDNKIGKIIGKHEDEYYPTGTASIKTC